jgi:predicted extracellular nuclease
MKKLFCAAAMLLCLAGQAMGQVRITEWMYNGSEFVELTNLGPSVVDFTGWSFDDDSRTPGTTSLSDFGSVAVGESVILAEALASTFRADWGLPASVKVIGGNSNNLGRSDEINIFDNTSALVDRLTYSDQNIAGSIRTDAASGNPSSAALLGANNVLGWQLSTLGDSFGSFENANGLFGNPGSYSTVPEPTTVALMLCSLAGLALIRR